VFIIESRQTKYPICTNKIFHCTNKKGFAQISLSLLSNCTNSGRCAHLFLACCSQNQIKFADDTENEQQHKGAEKTVQDNIGHRNKSADA